MKQLPPELQASPSPSSPAPSETADPSQSPVPSSIIENFGSETPSF
jgi:hypothetical protein